MNSNMAKLVKKKKAGLQWNPLKVKTSGPTKIVDIVQG